MKIDLTGWFAYHIEDSSVYQIKGLVGEDYYLLTGIQSDGDKITFSALYNLDDISEDCRLYDTIEELYEAESLSPLN